MMTEGPSPSIIAFESSAPPPLRGDLLFGEAWRFPLSGIGVRAGTFANGVYCSSSWLSTPGCFSRWLVSRPSADFT